LIEGQYYKAQLAYVTEYLGAGEYSSVGTFKYTTVPQLTLYSGDQELRIDGVGNKLTKQVACVYNTTDISEQVYWYTFDLYDYQ
jgi:hypothetical protein